MERNHSPRSSIHCYPSLWHLHQQRIVAIIIISPLYHQISKTRLSTTSVSIVIRDPPKSVPTSSVLISHHCCHQSSLIRDLQRWYLLYLQAGTATLPILCHRQLIWSTGTTLGALYGLHSSLSELTEPKLSSSKFTKSLSPILNCYRFVWVRSRIVNCPDSIPILFVRPKPFPRVSAQSEPIKKMLVRSSWTRAIINSYSSRTQT